MKKLLILTAAAMLTASAAGCRCGLFDREILGRPVLPGCEPACEPACNSCEGPMLGGDTYLAPPTILPGPIVQ